ncbi:MAG: tetratricopeptide repeat protein [Nitrospirota bacterium]
MQAALHLQQAGRFPEAEQLYREILRRQPGNPAVYCNLGFISQEKGQLDEARAFYLKAIRLNPDLAQAHYNLGVVLQARGNLEEAIDCYRKAAQSEENAMFYFNLGSALQEKGEFPDAESFYLRALELHPGYAKAHNNLGIVYKQMMQLEKAMLHITKALEIDPAFAEAHVNLAGMLIMQGDFSGGWREFEWRKKMQGFRHRNFSRPHWDGSDVSGRTVLLCNEQEARGFGDTIQCVRYLPLLAERGARVLVECQRELIPLLRNMEGVHSVIAEGEPLPAFDLYCHFLSLPACFHTSLGTIPATVPYLSVNTLLAEEWRNRVQSPGSRIKAGLVWAGEKKHDWLNLRSCTDALRSLPPRIKGASFFSLQKGDQRYPDSQEEETGIIDYMGDVHDFADTAALIMNLDLVISVDTAVAHLAGALGRPVWTLLPFVADARWLLHAEDTPWYPTMRLFRQPSPGDWNTVVARVAGELEKLVSSGDNPVR